MLAAATAVAPNHLASSVTSSTAEVAHVSGCATRQRLLEAAAPAFARDGYARATIRDICAAAGANIAAVNYHFGGKQGLYEEVVAYVAQLAAEAVARDAAGPGDGRSEPVAKPAAPALNGLIEMALHATLADGPPSWYGRLLVHELAAPSPSSRHVAEWHIAPLYRTLEAAVRSAIGPTVPEASVRHAALGVAAQCVLLGAARPLLEQAVPAQTYDEAERRRLAHDIASSTLASMEALKAQHARAEPVPA